MRLPNDPAGKAIFALAVTAALSGCSVFRGDGEDVASTDPEAVRLAAFGPQADYPMVLGDPFTVDGQEFVPTDTASYDAVGYAGADSDGGQGITIAHKTLPLPSYVEVAELGSGRTVLARVERRGPMTASRLVALSPGTMSALGIADGAPVRVRRVNPPEIDRAELRAGRKASDRMDTPKSLLGVLQRKLPGGATPPASLAQAPVKTQEPAKPATPAAVPPKPAPTPVVAAADPAPRATEAKRDSGLAVETRRVNTAYPLGSTPRASAPVAAPAVPKPQTPIAASVPTPAAGAFVIQAAAFSSKSNADRAATKLGGFVTQSGSFYRVRTGPYATRGQAEAALAKVREAGYSDARVSTAG